MKVSMLVQTLTRIWNELGEDVQVYIATRDGCINYPDVPLPIVIVESPSGEKSIVFVEP